MQMLEWIECFIKEQIEGLHSWKLMQSKEILKVCNLICKSLQWASFYKVLLDSVNLFVDLVKITSMILIFKQSFYIWLVREK